MLTLRFYGHANVSVTTEKGEQVLIDPFFKGNPLIKDQNLQKIKPRIIVITHGHSDHLGDVVEIAKQCGAIVVANFEIAKYLTNKGVNTHALHIGGSVSFPFCIIKLTPAVHGSMLPDGSCGGVAAGVLLFMDGKTILHAGDTGLTREFKTIGEQNPPDIAFFPVGDTFTMGPTDAGYAAMWTKARRVVPIHYNTWSPIRQIESDIRAAIEPYAEIVLLAPGEEYSL